MTDDVLHFMRVYDPTPFKRVWLALVLAAVVLKLWAAFHPSIAHNRWLGAFLLCSAAASLTRMSSLWDGGSEALIGLLGLAMALETAHVCSPRGWPGRYGSTACLCAALAAICGVAARGVPDYPGFTVWGYRARLYAQAAAFGLCLATALLSAIRWDRAEVRRACFALAMLALPLYGLLTRNTGYARWHTRMALAVGELLVLVAWIITAPGIPVRLRVSAGEKAVKTF
ncbi:MAG TPA: hypothetical protein VJQ82_18025 [Terriglobales bacterium]|nr:hypothetical protein [Terriglobales bacterium]